MMIDYLTHVGMMLGAHAAMTDAERSALAAWERQHVTGDGELATSDWPGWRSYVPDRLEPRARAVFVKRSIPRGLRTRVLERDAYRCRHCGGHTDLRADHIVPESAGGPTTFENLQTLCTRCNSRKGSRVDGR